MPSSFRIALAITEERKRGLARSIGRGQVVYYSAPHIQYNLEQSGTGGT
jgi:hypothetical protein